MGWDLENMTLWDPSFPKGSGTQWALGNLLKSDQKGISAMPGTIPCSDNQFLDLLY